MRRFALLWFLVLLAFPALARQETAPPTTTLDPPAQTEPVPDETPEEEEPPALQGTPYATWTRHSGPVETCVARVRVGAVLDHSAFEVTGVVIRCDGFILVPDNVTDALNAGALVKVLVTGAEHQKIAEPLPVAGWLRGLKTRARYNLIKVNDAHLRCAPLLNYPWAQPGTPVRILEAIAKGAGLCGSEEKRAVIGGTGAKADALGLMDETGKPVFATPGSVVVDKESGAVLGIVTAAGAEGTSSQFSTFFYFHDSINEVALVPDRQALVERAKETPPPGMVYIGGGAVPMTDSFYRKMYKTAVACAPGFFVDRYMVTNHEYRDFLLTDPTRKQPDGWWQHDELTNPVLLPTYPVAGVGPGDAFTYALVHHKRLLTQVEWKLVARGAPYKLIRAQCIAFGARYGELMSAISRFRLAYAKALALATQKNPVEDPQRWLEEAGRLRLFIREAMSDFRSLSYENIPTLTAPVGLRQYDKAGQVYDVLMNADELVQGRGQSMAGAGKPFYSLTDALISTVRINYNQREATGTFLEIAQGKTDLFQFDSEIPLWLAFLCTNGSSEQGRIDESQVTTRTPTGRPTSPTRVLGLEYDRRAKKGAGFRCAR